jgi:two-component system, OmpR family, sensor kinase
MKLPIRVRLAAAFAATLAIILAAVGIFVYARFRTDAVRTIDTELHNRSAALFAVADPDPRLRVDLLGLSDEHFGQVLDRNGDVVASSAQLRDRPIAAATPGIRDAWVTTRHERRRVRLLVTRRGDTTLVLASALDDRDDALHSLSNLLWIAGGLTFVIATGLAWVLAGAALRPVERLRAAAGAYSASDLTQRLDVPASDDELHRLAVTLNEMLDRIQGSFERQRAFVDRASHELRTPLANLSLQIELALRRPRTESQLRAALESAADESERLDRLASNLLVLARTTDRVLPVALEETDLTELVRATAATFDARADAEGIELRTTLDESGLVPVDPIRIGQALSNLLDNALRVTPRDGTVTVQLRRAPERVVLSVRDTGPGFTPEVRAAAFDLFVRGPQGLRSPDGAGLGLAIVAAVAEAHRGHAHIAGSDSGAMVTLELPALAPT